MKVEIKIPTMGESVVEATIGTILKPSGSAVKADEEVLEIETEKVNQVLSAPAAGQVQLTVKQGDVVKVGQTIGFVDTASAGTPVLPLRKRQNPLLRLSWKNRKLQRRRHPPQNLPRQALQCAKKPTNISRKSPPPNPLCLPCLLQPLQRHLPCASGI